MHKFWGGGVSLSATLGIQNLLKPKGNVEAYGLVLEGANSPLVRAWQGSPAVTGSRRGVQQMEVGWREGAEAAI